MIGSHPEAVSTGERYDLMQAILRYILDRPGVVNIKADLVNGATRVMDQETSQNDPTHTMIGDLQLHHFRLVIPEGVVALEIHLEGEAGYDFQLNTTPGELAFSVVAEFSSSGPGADHTLNIDHPQAGEWFVAVKAKNTIQTTGTTWGSIYYGPLAVLNGLPYSITATWSYPSGVTDDGVLPKAQSLGQNYPNPFNGSTIIPFVLNSESMIRITLINDRGQAVKELANGTWAAGQHQVQVKVPELASGIYYYTLERPRQVTETNKLLLLK